MSGGKLWYQEIGDIFEQGISILCEQGVCICLVVLQFVGSLVSNESSYTLQVTVTFSSGLCPESQ